MDSPGVDPVPSTHEITRLLSAVSAGDRRAAESLLTHVYTQLRAIAHNRMKGERAGHTLEPTALVHEAFIRLIGPNPPRWEDRGHFFRAAADSMRKILIDHARARNADKRGGGRAALSISNIAELPVAENPSGFLALDDAILRLEQVDARSAEVVRLRFYAGLPEESTADALGVSIRTVRREWAFARAWLRDALERQAADDQPTTP
jgi:RNA polymerase sigma factor (TIGR02999 family)